MIAVVIAKDALPCVIQFTRRVGLHVDARTWCGKEYNAGNGIWQLPDGVKICLACAEEIRKFEQP